MIADMEPAMARAITVIGYTTYHKQRTQVGKAKTQCAEFVRQTCHFTHLGTAPSAQIFPAQRSKHDRHFQTQLHQNELLIIIELAQVDRCQVTGGVVQEHIF